ncbi:MAG: DUF2298 domain-containing protein [Desulfopila sp.]|jgi:YYY domain-containing protein|nr:DUF2298 domain-containing protein [Desulfopila sp.]
MIDKHVGPLWYRNHPFVFAVVVISLGVCLRFTGGDFDDGHHLHPDERFLNMVVAEIEWPETLTAYFDTQHSPLNPVNHNNYKFFVYGTFPIFLGKAIGDLTGTGDYNGFLMTGRMLSAIADTIAIVLVFLLCRRFFSYYTGLVAATLYSCAVFPIQISHFFTVDPFLNLFLLAALYYVLDFSCKPEVRSAVLTGIFWGFAMASKISGLVFIVPIVLVCALSLKNQGLFRTVLLGTLILIVAAFCFRLFNPYAFSAVSWYSLHLDERFLANLATLRILAEPFSGFPPSLQWALRTPVLFSLKNMANWGIGIPFFATALLGLVLLAYQNVSNKKKCVWIVIAWGAVSLGLVGAQSAQTMRYLLPLYPLAAIFAAYCLVALRDRLAIKFFSCWPIVFVVGTTLCWALAFSSIYRQPNTRVEASRWIYENIPVGSSLAVEHWDDALPLFHSDRTPDEYKLISLKLTDPDTIEKKDTLVTGLEESDYIVISSNRLYGSLTRLKEIYPLSYRYYQLLFGNLSGFSLVAEFISSPELGGVSVPDDTAEEAFTVYDHPRVLIFKKNVDFSPDFLTREFEALALPQLSQNVPSQPISPITSLGLEKLRKAELIYLFRWIVVFWLVGLAGKLASRRFFPGTGFPGRSVVALGGTFIYALGLQFNLWTSNAGVLLALIVLVLMAFGAIWQEGSGEYEKEDGSHHPVFWGIFFLFLILRAWNPAIFWGERPFDFALLNAMMRTEALPPFDPWMSQHPLNYHAWGQLFIAFWGRVAHIPPEYVYNLGAALIPALVAELVFWTVQNFTKKVYPAVVCVVVMIFSGNLSAWVLHPWNNGFTFQDFWEASRIVPGTINEFPFWTALFADLHGHYIGMVFSVLFLAACSLMITNRNLQWQISALQGFALGALTLTNPWALPVYLVAGVLLTARNKEAGEFLPPLFALCIAFLVVIPFWRGQQSLISISWAEGKMSAVQICLLFGPFLLIYILYLLREMKASMLQASLFAGSVCLVVWFSQTGVAVACIVLLTGMFYLWKKPCSPPLLFLHVLMITGLLVFTGCEFFTLWDHMNTIFKYHYEIWILFSMATALISKELIGGKIFFKCNHLPVLLILGLGLLTPVCVLIAWWQNPLAEVEKITLNGFAYLEKNNPGEASLVHWLRRVRQQPVISEAFGPSYGEYSRVSSFTGLPTVIGWEYHVFQHGHLWEEIKKRQKDLQSFYQDPARMQAVMDTYTITYGVLGELEKKAYGPEAGAGWREAGWSPLFKSHDAEVWGSTR